MSRAPLCSAVLLAPWIAFAQGGIGVRVVQGDGAINSIRMSRGHDPVVRVVDADGAAAAGATVTFLLPASGPGGSFQDGGLSLTIQTDPQGLATGRGLKPNRTEGEFRIRVTASWRGQTASATLTQTNTEPTARSSTPKIIAIVALVGGAAAGIALGVSHGGNSSTSSSAAAATTATSTGTVIVAGTPTLGPPH